MDSAVRMQTALLKMLLPSINPRVDLVDLVLEMLLINNNNNKFSNKRSKKPLLPTMNPMTPTPRN